MAERQYGTRYEEIRADHMGRYEWAAGKVEGLVIDAACGCGYGAHYMAEKAGVKVHAIDTSPDAIAYAMKHWHHPDVQVWPATLPDVVFARADWVVSFETIEHLEKPERALKRFRAAAPNLLVSVPNQDVVPYSAERFPFHVRHYTPAQFADLLLNAGWRVVDMLSQRDANTRKPEHGDEGRTLIAVCERDG